MNQFVKNVFASCLGVAIAMVGIFFLGIFLIAGLAGSGDAPTVVSDSSVLHLTFDQPVPEQTNNLEMNPFDFDQPEILGLNDIVKTIEHAATDDKIKGIYLNPENGLGMGVASAASVRAALVKFKESGKFVVAYAKSYTQGAYYLSSVADKVYLNPVGSVDLHGFAAVMPFFKDMLDRIGVKMEVFYAGDFKSATEPYRRNEMSEQNRLQLREYLQPVFKRFLTDISQSRGKSVEELEKITNSLLIGGAKDAVALGLVDSVAHLDNVLAHLKLRAGIEPDAKLNSVRIEDYATSFKKDKNYKAKEKIALVFAEGTILANQGEVGTIVDDQYVKLLRKIREDEKIKAIVLRVNSPGGSAIASENIWRELSLAKQAGKKVVVSMGDYAASGGYYISCMADKIVAEPSTLTGSIGVYSMMPNASKLSSEKLGIHWDTVKTSKYAVGLNPFVPLSPAEMEHMQASTMQLYNTFLQRVADGRGMVPDSVHKIAQGRVWTGLKAKEIGLVDEVGNLDRAIALAAELAGLEQYRLMEYPAKKDPMQEFIAELTGQGDEDGIRSKVLEKELGTLYPYYREIKQLLSAQGVQARLPVIVPFE